MSNLSVSTGWRELINKSRERCRNVYRLEEKATHPVMRLQDSELVHRRNEFLDRIGGFAPELDRRALLPEDFGHCLLVADSNGFVVEAYSPANREQEFRLNGLTIGSLFDERLVGTNGIALAMSCGHVVSVVGAEHFHRCFHGVACSSAPLLDAQANLIGSVTLVAPYTRRSAELAWCETMLTIASARFQDRLFSNAHAGCMTARLFSEHSGPMSYFESIVSCDDRGVIIASVPLTRSIPPPGEHRDLVGRHLSELSDVKISIRAPAQDPSSPRSRIQTVRGISKIRKFPGKELGRLTAQSADMYSLVERARKLLAHRVPLLLCGAPGTGKNELVTLLLDDMRLTSPRLVQVDCATLGSPGEFDEVLAHAGFLSEHSIESCPPVMVLLNVNQLEIQQLRELEALLRRLDLTNTKNRRCSTHSVLIFTADGSWPDLLQDQRLTDGLLFRMGQAIIEVPPIKHRDIETVIDNILEDEFGPIGISERAKETLLSYDWPGNLIELRGVLREALACGNGVRINVADLPSRICQPRPSPSIERNAPSVLHEILDSTNWNVTRTARLLGKSRATINRWINEQGLQRPH